MDREPVYEYEEALEYLRIIDEEGTDNEEFSFSPQADLWDDSFPNKKPYDDIEDINNMMKNFQQYISEILRELTILIKNEPEVIDEVDVEYELLSQDQNVSQILVKAVYKDYSYNQIMITPTYDWENDKDELMLYIKALIVKQYRNQ